MIEAYSLYKEKGYEKVVAYCDINFSKIDCRDYTFTDMHGKEFTFKKVEK